jgi:hypothetical protein
MRRATGGEDRTGRLIAKTLDALRDSRTALANADRAIAIAAGDALPERHRTLPRRE